MFCSKCGNEIVAQAKFCSKCGQPVNASNSGTPVQNNSGSFTLTINRAKQWFAINPAVKVVVDALTTRIIGPKMMYEDDGKTYTEFFNNYIQQLQTTLDKYEETKEELVKIGNLKRRINILKANMVDLYVGGIGVADRDALRDSVEDAVLNCRSAAKEGVGHAANFEGLSAFNKLNTKYSDIRKKAHEDTDGKSVLHLQAPHFVTSL